MPALSFHPHLRRRLLGLTAFIVLALGAVPAIAQAQTLYVSPAPAGSDSGTCQVQSSPCATIAYALGQASQGATISLAAGTYDEALTISAVSDKNVSIVGAGSGTGGSVISSSSAPVTLQQPGVTLSNLELDSTGTASALLGAGESETLNAVTVDMLDGASGAIAVQTGPGATVEGSTITGPWTGQGVVSNGGLTLSADSITSSANSTQSLVTLNGISSSDHFDVVDSLLDQANTGGSLPPYTLGLVDGDLVMDSSLLVGGQSAVSANESISGYARIISSTLDAATPGISDSGDDAVSVQASGGTFATTLAGSITVEPQAVENDGGTATLACTDSDVPSQSQTTNGTIACVTGTDGNTSTPAAQIFSDPSGFFSSIPADYALNASWAGVNSVPESAVTLPTGYTPSAVDLIGNPRVTNASNTCAAPIRDRGALEVTATNGPAISTIAGPATGASNQSLVFTAEGAIPPGSTSVSYSWQSSDGASAAGASFTHAFSALGTYTVTLTSLSSTGCSATVQKTVTITKTGTASTGTGAASAGTPDVGTVKAPSITFLTPVAGESFARGQHVVVRFKCAEASGGPGIASCTGTDKVGSVLKTTSLGAHTFTVTAVSRDGLRTTHTIKYHVIKPSNQLAVVSEGIARNGEIRLQIQLPSAGKLSVMETAWKDNLAKTALRSGADVLAPAPGRFVFAQVTVSTRAAGVVELRLKPTATGRRLIAHHRYAVTIRQWLQFTPTGGSPRTLGFTGLHLT